ncbi:hypothetical protein GPECTOR_3g449 [Gonium pectorale]|uniref:Uncharacterized protein n=1 Tax=Gonium pectorale TaxID=33097 RepID=A0A150GZS2_GONPE|nr:hypothetical protein GPECTOR_3g449 [Gonium pectorale]|eukprot:KXZ55315.1 hypothetical protein GPECTOR_3g449 [Gonium pectorale]
MLNKNNKKEISAIEDLIKAKVYVNPTRFEELTRIKEQIWSANPKKPEAPGTLLCLNPSPGVEEALRGLPDYNLQVEHICDDPSDPTHKKDRKRFVKLFKKLEQAGHSAVVHHLGSQDEELTMLDRRVIALSLLARLPVVCVATACPDPLPAASAASGDTWPVFFVPHPEDTRQLREWLSTELPRVRTLAAAIEAELQARVEHLARVNAPLHFLKRASVALVPFGVMTVNFLGILRLMATMLGCVGMRGDTSANKALGLLGAQNAALVTAVDSMGDVYSFAVFATVLADLQGMGLMEAAAAMDVLDGLMLGSISVVTGAVSALGAYLSRPVVVRAAASFLASLQTIHVLNPSMRRATEKRPGGGRGGKGGRRGKGKGEETEGLLAASRSGALGVKGGEGKGKGKGKGGKGAEEGGAAALRARREAEAEAALAEVAAAGLGAEEGGEEEEREGGDDDDAATTPSSSEDEGEAAQAEAGAAGAAAVADAKAAKAAAKAAKKAARLEEKERKRQAKQELRERRAAEKAAAAEAKAVEKAATAERKAAEKAAAAERKAAEKAAKEEARLQRKAGGGGPTGSSAAPEGAGASTSASSEAAAAATATAGSVRWWQRKRSVPPAAEAATGSAAAPGGGGNGDGSGGSGSGSEDDDEDEEGEAAGGMDERMGLDEQTRQALAQFLSLAEEEVFDADAAAAAAAAASGGAAVGRR